MDKPDDLTATEHHGVRSSDEDLTAHTPVEVTAHTSVEMTTRSPVEVIYDALIPVKMPAYAPVEVTAPVSAEVTKPLPAEVTSHLPVEMTSSVPFELTSALPVDVTTPLPAEVTSHLPVKVTSPLPVVVTSTLPTKVSTPLPAEVTSLPPVEVTFTLPAEMRSSLPAEVTTALPSKVATAIPVEVTTPLPSEVTPPLPVEGTTEVAAHIPVDLPTHTPAAAPHKHTVMVTSHVHKMSVVHHLQHSFDSAADSPLLEQDCSALASSDQSCVSERPQAGYLQIISNNDSTATDQSAQQILHVQSEQGEGGVRTSQLLTDVKPERDSPDVEVSQIQSSEHPCLNLRTPSRTVVQPFSRTSAHTLSSQENPTWPPTDVEATISHVEVQQNLGDVRGNYMEQDSRMGSNTMGENTTVNTPGSSAVSSGASSTSNTLAVSVTDSDVVTLWNKVKEWKEMRTDSDFARFLLSLYFNPGLESERSQCSSKCVHCSSPLTFCCITCLTSLQQPPPALSSAATPPPSQPSACTALTEDNAQRALSNSPLHIASSDIESDAGAVFSSGEDEDDLHINMGMPQGDRNQYSWEAQARRKWNITKTAVVVLKGCDSVSVGNQSGNSKNMSAALPHQAPKRGRKPAFTVHKSRKSESATDIHSGGDSVLCEDKTEKISGGKIARKMASAEMGHVWDASVQSREKNARKAVNVNSEGKNTMTSSAVEAGAETTCAVKVESMKRSTKADKTVDRHLKRHILMRRQKSDGRDMSQGTMAALADTKSPAESTASVSTTTKGLESKGHSLDSTTTTFTAERLLKIEQNSHSVSEKGSNDLQRRSNAYSTRNRAPAALKEMESKIDKYPICDGRHFTNGSMPPYSYFNEYQCSKCGRIFEHKRYMCRHLKNVDCDFGRESEREYPPKKYRPKVETEKRRSDDEWEPSEDEGRANENGKRATISDDEANQEEMPRRPKQKRYRSHKVLTLKEFMAGKIQIPVGMYKKSATSSPLKYYSHYTCFKCPKVFVSKVAFDSHQFDYHHGERFDEEDAELQQKEFDAESLQILMEIKEQRLFCCPHCNQIFMNSEQHKMHVSSHFYTVGEDGTHTCHFCGHSFAREILLRQHRRVPKEKRICQKCGFQFSSRCQIQRHLQVHRQEEKQKCKECEESFVGLSKLEIRQHMKAHKLPKPSALCPICGKNVERSKYNYHLQSVHEKTKYLCSVCNKELKTKMSLTHHMKLHENKRLQCEYCGKYFREQKSLNHHKAYRHQGKCFECKECGKKLSKKSNLKTHIQIVHRKIKPHVCTICGLGCIYSAELKVHMRVHTGEKPFQCQYCPSRFARRDYLKLHTRTHTGKRPYRCKDCGQSFICRSSLTLHRRNRHKDKTFPCSVCGQEFPLRSSLEFHCRVEHGGDLPVDLGYPTATAAVSVDVQSSSPAALLGSLLKQEGMEAADTVQQYNSVTSQPLTG